MLYDGGAIFPPKDNARYFLNNATTNATVDADVVSESALIATAVSQQRCGDFPILGHRLSKFFKPSNMNPVDARCLPSTHTLSYTLLLIGGNIDLLLMTSPSAFLGRQCAHSRTFIAHSSLILAHNASGECFGLLGKNSAGKSTCMRMAPHISSQYIACTILTLSPTQLTGDLPPTLGDAYSLGNPVTKQTLSALAGAVQSSPLRTFLIL